MDSCERFALHSPAGPAGAKRGADIQRSRESRLLAGRDSVVAFYELDSSNSSGGIVRPDRPVDTLCKSCSADARHEA